MTESKQPDHVSEFGRLMNTKEDLHPDLVPWITSIGAKGMTALKHPLVYEVPYFEESNAITNRHYQQKQEMLAKARMAGDWSRIVFLHERPWRVQAFQTIIDQIDDKTYWDLLHSIWIDSENIWQNKKDWIELLSSDRPGSFMDEDDKAEFDKLPESFTVYRGYIRGYNQQGLSFTLSKDKALWFAKRFRRKDQSATVRERVVKKSQVFAYTNARNEQEIIILP